MLTLYHAPQSRSSRIVWLLEELGADYELIITDIPRQDGSGAADPRNPHPDKKVPALVHDGALITESIAVVQYLADLYSKAGLAPAIGDPRRGPYLTWLAYYAGVVEPVVTLQFAGMAEHPLLQRTFRDGAAVASRIGAALESNAYLLGEDFSAVDVVVASMGQYVRSALPPGPRVDDYLRRCGSRPALARAQARDAG
ncbi:MAG TPA: glutathione S-transferase family protein [Thermoanaerobaculia bacterium]|jgi:glutathione S-transferase|nr:glutathione S-transferase family protein [Thermoanaerobaculia bacterium]